MFFRVPTTALILAAASFLCLASGDSKPACNAENLGRLWPEAANDDPKLRQKMARCGELEHCTRGSRHRRFHYHWESLTVRIDQLPGGAKLAKPAGCEVAPEAAVEPNVPGLNKPEPATSRTR
jgi:hypothetical protein